MAESPANASAPGPVAASTPTIADLRSAGTVGAAACALEADALATPIDGVRLAGQDAGGTRDVLITSRVPTTLPDGVVAVITRHTVRGRRAVPVLVASADASWAEILDDVLDVVGPHRGRRAAAAAREALRVPLVEGGGWTRLAAVAGGLLDTAVAVVDDHLDALAAFPDEAGDALAEAAAGTSGGASSLWQDPAEGMWAVPVCGPDGRVVAVVVAAADGPPTVTEAAVLDEIATAAALEWGREELRTATETQLRGDLIRELMAGEDISRESLLRRGRHLGADLAGGAVALLGAIGDPTSPDTADPRAVARLLRQARGVVDMHWPHPALVDWDAGRLLLLLPGSRDAAQPDDAPIEQRAHVLATRLIAATADAVPGLTLAVSRFTPHPERLGSALDEAGLALSIGFRLGRAGDVVTFEETGTYTLLFQIFADRPEELARFYEQTIDPLVRYDEQYQTELVGTMATYLELDGNLAATAATLFTHRHTVRYRLDRIAELSGLDVGRTEDREKLTLGLKAMRLLGKKVPVPMAKEAALRQGR